MSKQLILTLLTLLMSIPLFSGSVTNTKTKSGSSISTGMTLSLVDVDKTCMISSPSCVFKLYKTQFLAKLEYEDKLKEVRGVWNMTVNYDIEFTYDDNTTHTVSGQSLAITYDPTNDYTDIDYAEYISTVSGKNYIEAKLLNVVVVPTGSIPSDINLSLEYTPTKYYPLEDDDKTMVSYDLITGYDKTKNELQLYWNALSGAESYDLEWLFIDAGNDLTFNESYPYDFKNAIRVNVTQPNYAISLAYPNGLLIFRVRGRSPYVSTTNHLYGEGQWSTEDLGTLDPTTNHQYGQKQGASAAFTYLNAFRYQGMDKSKNWQYSASFAEDGKRKEVVSFYDGAMYNRQSVTLSNSTDKAIVGQTIYDFTGRPAINVMPAPLTSTGIHYYDNRPPTDVSNHPSASVSVNQGAYDNIARNSSNEPYSYADFDLKPGSGYLPIPNPMSSTHSTGAANYYSPNTTATGEFKNYLPDAKELPFTRTIYSDDGTNRVIRQSGVGETHQINAKDTRYFYLTPNTQKELDRLFGNEVGAVINYKKNVVLDPNGQASVSYIDGKGRTIATALLAGQEGKLLNINTRPVATPTITADLTDFNKITGKDKLISAKPIFITSAGDHQFKYELPAVLFADCGPTPCHYKLTVYIKNEATGTRVNLEHNSGPGSVTSNYLYAEISSATTPEIVFTAADLSFGKYTVVKELAINHDLLDLAVASFLADNACDTENTSPCYPFIAPKAIDNCCEYNCEQEYIRIDVATQNKLVYDDNGNHIGTILYADYSTENPIPLALNTLTSFVSPYDNDDWKVIRDKIKACEDECSANFSACEVKYNTLKAEMSPFGQYFDNLPDPGNPNQYLDQETPLTAMNLSGNTQGSWDGVRTNWQDNWGDITVKEHPEYCIYQKFCCVEQEDQSGELFFAPVFIDYPASGTSSNQVTLINGCAPNGISTIENSPPDPILDQLLSDIDNVNTRLDIGGAEKDIIKQGLNFKAITYQIQKDQDDCPSLVETTSGSRVTTAGFTIHYPIIDLTALTSVSDPTIIANQLIICESTCQGSVESWKNQFKCFEALSAPDKISFEKALLDICMESCKDNSSNPMPDDACINCTGASAVHFTVEGNTGTSVNYTATTFKQVVDQFRNHTDYTNLFDPLCPTPTYPVEEENCLCTNIFDFAVANSTFSYTQLPHNFPDFLSAGFDLEAILLTLTGSTLSSKYSDAYTDCMDKKTVAPDAVPEIFRCDDIIIDITPEDIEVTCVNAVNYQNLFNAKQAFNTFLQNKAQQWRSDYIDECMAKAKTVEKFSFDYLLDEYHYTLYFYDQADNLIKTVPPEGIYQEENGTVSFDASANIDTKASENHRKNATNPFEYPYYAMWTNYKYNSLNQLMEQSTPDGGTSHFFYDPLGRLIASQNAEQGTRNAYSFTEFDDLGRIKKVGELINTTPLTDEIARNLLNAIPYTTWLAGASAGGTTQIVETFYDGIPSGSTLVSPIPQNNLRNRIAAVAYNKEGNTSYESASFYDYDINGNVQVLAQQNTDATNIALGTENKIMTYEYDLVSGNVNQVSYQAGEKDEFYHQYEYDADNRLTVAYTSRNGIIWEKESKNLYYEHGPLARTEIGDKQVQAQDYAYTIQGWLKTINSSMGEHLRDLGKDGNMNGANLNQYFARDAYGFSLHYYQGDYIAVNPTATNGVIAGINNLDFNTKSPDLYNGNISKMVVGLTQNDKTKEQVSGKAYQYDQLNRIRTYHDFINPTNDQARIDNDFANVTTSGNFYNSTYEYDGNGNITKLKRNGGIGSSVDMDDFDYIYSLQPKVMGTGGLVTVRGDNKLYQVTDTKASGNYQTDLDDQAVDNYRYDNIGRLTYDREAKIEDPINSANPAIFWNVANKITKILKKNGNIISFEYDPMGNRLSKNVETASDNRTTYYVRDAQGNVMATYNNVYTKASGGLSAGNLLTLSDLHIYGSSRLGTKDEKDLFINASGGVVIPPNLFDNTSRTLGTKRYELSNHLGNVLEVISDRKLAKFKSSLVTFVPSIINLQGTIINSSGHIVNYPHDGVGWNDGGNSLEQITGNGNLEWVIPNQDYPGTHQETFIIGLSDLTATSSGYQDINYAWYTFAGGKKLYIYESSVNIGQFGTYSIGDVLKIERVGSSINYYHNGALIYTSLTPSTGNIRMDFSYYWNGGKMEDYKMATGANELVYSADVISYSDYYPFGMLMPNRYTGNSDYKYSFNGMEKDNEIQGDNNSLSTDFRQYDPRIGRWLSSDKLEKDAPNWSPYRFGFDNPIIYYDKDGKYEHDGHYWTVLVVATMLKKTNAKALAYYAEHPDHIMTPEGAISYATNTWLHPGLQKDVHALTGGDPAKERAQSRANYKFSKNDEERGHSLHRLGDSYAHTNPKTGKMYKHLVGHAAQGTSPDKIKNRPYLYLDYVSDLVNTIGGSEASIDISVFAYITKNKFTSNQNAMVLKTEYKMLEGINNFTIDSDSRDAVEGYLKEKSSNGDFTYSVIDKTSKWTDSNGAVQSSTKTEVSINKKEKE